MVATSANGHDKPIQQTLVISVTTSTLSQSNSYTYSDAKNVRECNKPTVQLRAGASVAMFPRWIKNCMQAQTAGNNVRDVRVDTLTSSRIQSATKLFQLQHVWRWSQQPKRLSTGIRRFNVLKYLTLSDLQASTRQRIPTPYQVSQFNHRALPVTMQNAWCSTDVPVWNP
jgi:hypothetical protein